MRKFVRTFAVVIAVVMMALGGAGCVAKKAPNSETDLEIRLWEAGFGRDFMDKIVAAFKEDHPEINVFINATADSSIGELETDGTINTTDLYFITMQSFLRYKDYLEPLTDMLEEDSDGVPLGSKLDEFIVSYMKDENGDTYTLPWGTSIGGILYNKDYFEEYGYEVPRTTDELVALVNKAASKRGSDSSAPYVFLHLAAYWKYMLYAWQAQYDGYEAGLDAWKFIDPAAPEKGDAQLSSLTRNDTGRYKAVDALYHILSPENALYPGSNGMGFTDSQTRFLNGQSLMMPNGNWIEYEMRNTQSKIKIGMMRTPVLSALGTKLGISDTLLGEVVSYIDGDTDRYDPEDIADIDPEVIERVREIRNIMYSEMPNHSAFIPNYSVAKEAAKEFLRFFYSDEATQIFYDTLKLPSAVKFSDGRELDTSGWSDFSKEATKLYSEAKLAFMVPTHPIFYRGGAISLWYHEPATAFTATEKKDRLTLDQYWQKETNYWNVNWNNILELAGLK